MVQYASLSAFWLLVPLAAAIAYIFIRRRNRRPTLQFSSVQVVKQIPSGLRVRLRWLPTFLRISAIIFMIVALARPQEASTKIKKNVEGVDIILLVDLSPTMIIEDMEPQNRLEAAKIAQIEFVRNRPNDRIGIVAFSGEAYTAVPLTLDHKIVIDTLNRLENSDRLKMGTAQGVAIATSVARLKDSTAKSRIIVFITDGENNTGVIDPETALEIAKGFGIRIYTIGVGKEGESQLPIPSKDAFGRKVIRYQKMTTTFHEDAMLRIAEETGGKYWRSRNMKELSEVYATIDRLEKTKLDSNTFTKYKELFPPYVQLAFFLFVGGWFLNQMILKRNPA